jgi:hypothetical protein
MRDKRSEQVMLIAICTTMGFIGLVYVTQLLI